MDAAEKSEVKRQERNALWNYTNDSLMNDLKRKLSIVTDKFDFNLKLKKKVTEKEELFKF